MDFVPIYSGYACIRRYIRVQNPKAVRLDEKCPPLPLCSAKCERTFEGVLIYGGGGRNTTKIPKQEKSAK